MLDRRGAAQDYDGAEVACRWHPPAGVRVRPVGGFPLPGTVCELSVRPDIRLESRGGGSSGGVDNGRMAASTAR